MYSLKDSLLFCGLLVYFFVLFAVTDVIKFYEFILLSC